MSMIQPQSVLAITATAGPKVVSDICHILDIRRDSGTDVIADETPEVCVRVMNCDRNNIDVSCYVLSSQEERLSKERHFVDHTPELIVLIIELTLDSILCSSSIFSGPANTPNQEAMRMQGNLLLEASLFMSGGNETLKRLLKTFRRRMTCVGALLSTTEGWMLLRVTKPKAR